MVSEQTTRAPARTFTDGEKASFFAAFERLGSIRLAAEELGFKPMTCRHWVTLAGIDVKVAQRARRTEYFRLRADAVPRQEAARQVGLNIRTAVDWDQGIRHADNRWVLPDGRIIDYNTTVTALSDSHIRLTPAQLKPINSRYLSLVDREAIRDLSATGMSIRSIAATLRRAPSTISREIIRNRQKNLTYLPYAAQRAAAARRPRPREAKLVTQEGLRKFVQEKLQIRWSPEQICQALVKQYPTDKDMRVVPETIYQALYVQARGGLRRAVQEALRSGRTRRKPQKTESARRPRFRDPMVMIADRPPEIEDRAVPGHWEGDLITGRLNKTAIATLVERTTRYVMLVHLPGAHTADAVRDGLV
ncbi:IS30 family transposase, partial [Cryobacterium sp. TMT1-66-1]|uniref:IS30 family transposase n=1 Tax=Cryobacterium sp. TMT1-66-1 TaxID=1259242 RepID=UPI00106AF26B